MAYVNVAEWKPDQVTEWLKGLDNAIIPYLHLILSNEVNGQQLLNVQPDDLGHWGVQKLGHQEIILEAVEHLRNFHYELDRENLQLLALRLSCQANSLYNELCKQTDSQPLSTQTLADVASVVRAAKPLVCWLDRSPFSGQHEYMEKKTELLKHSLAIAICAQRDRFAERPVEEIRANCAELAALADSIIQGINDPLILQPASLDLATLRKRVSSDLGFFIVPSFHGVHQICKIKFGSPAHQCGKVEEGDEVVQVNYQTVVGWQQNKVMALFEESPSDVFLTLKKRPRHTKVYGQIYMKPYRLPSKKRAAPYTRWHENLPSPRPELLTIPDFEIPLPRTPPQAQALRPVALEQHRTTNPSVSSESDDDALFLSGSGGDEAEADYDLDGHASPTSMRLYLPKPRIPVQRRATITGASPVSQRPPVDLEKFWRELKLEKRWRGSDPATATQENSDLNEFRNRRPDDPGGEIYTLRDKSSSLQANFPREQTERPSTCLGIEKLPLERPTPAARTFVKRSKQSTSPQHNTVIAVDPPVPKPREGATSPTVVEDPVRNAFEVFGARRNKPKSPPSKPHEKEALESEPRQPCVESKLYISRLELQVTPNDVEETDNGSKSESEEKEEKKEASRKTSTDSQVGDLPSPSVHHRERGRLDKSHSTPAYDLNLAECEVLELVRERRVSRVKEEADGSHAANEPNQPNPSDEPPPVSPRQFKPEPDSCPEIRINDMSSDDVDQDMLSMKFDEALPVECSYTDNDSPSFSSSLWGESHLESNTSDLCDQNCGIGNETESHGRVVETINRHILMTNLGKEDDDSSAHSEPEDACYNKGLSLTTPDLVTDTQNRRNLLIDGEPTNENGESGKVDDENSATKLDNQNQNHIHINPQKAETRTENAPDNINSFSLDKDGIGCSKIGLILNTINNALKQEDLKEYKFSESKETARGPILNIFPRKECGSVHPVPKNTNMYGMERLPDSSNAAIPPIIQRQPKMLPKMPNKTSLTPPEPPPRPPPNQSKSNLSVQTPVGSQGPSPTGGLRAMMVNMGSKGSAPKGLFSSPKTVRKKNPLLAKRRDIGVRELGTPDCQGWLSRRLRGGGTGAQWVKGWFMLKGTTFYGFKSKEAQKADCFISLPGFTISQAEEVKSRRHAFKVYHTGTVFYFAADSEEELTQWLDRLSQATLALDAIIIKASHSEGAVFSETEDEADEPEPTESCFPSPKMRKLANFLSGHSSLSAGGPSPKPARSHQNLASSSEPKIHEIQKKFGSLKKLGYRSKHSAPPPSPSPQSHASGSATSLNTTDSLPSDLAPISPLPPPSAPHSLDRKYLRFLSSNKNQNVPVPTAQFRSYRRVVAPDNACSTLPAGTKIADSSASGQAAGGAPPGAAAVLGYPSNAGVYEQHRLPGERGQGMETPGSFRGRHFLHQSAESVLGSFDESEISSHPPPSTSPRPAVPPRKDLIPSTSHGEAHSSLHSSTPSMDMADYRLTASGRRARRLNLSAPEETGSFAPNRPEIDRRHPHRATTTQLEASSGTVNLMTANEAYAGYTEDPVSSLQRQQASLERRRNSPPPPPVARARGSPSTPVPAPRPAPPLNVPAAAPSSSAPPIARRTPVTAHRQKKNSDRPVESPPNQAYRGGSPEKMWVDPPRLNFPGPPRHPPSPSLLTSEGVSGVSAACGLHGLKNAALYQPPPVAFGAQSSFGTTFEMNLDQRVLSGDIPPQGDSNSRTKTTSKLRQLFSPRHGHGQSSPPHGHKATLSDSPQRVGGLHNIGQASGHQKTLLGSPRLHRALFRHAEGRKQKPVIVRSESSSNSLHSPSGGGASASASASGSQQSTSLSSSPSSSSISSPDWPHESYCDSVNSSSPKPTMGVAMLGKKPFPAAAPRNLANIPHNPMSPPPDYPGLEYPPVFEPGTYSLSDTSTLLQRTPSRQDMLPPNLNGHNDRSSYS